MTSRSAPHLTVEATPIPGLLVLRLPVHADPRGWFKENWQRAKMTALGLPDFAPVQHNVSYNTRRGATRGVHAEPWDKLVSVDTGRVFAAWVDLRDGETFGSTFSLEVDPGVAVFVPRGVGNAYQALEDGTAYSYLVNAHWRPGIDYPALALDDPAAAIPWPIPLPGCEISEKDRANPRLDDLVPVGRRRPLVLGAHGQLGRALTDALPDALALGRTELDLSDASALDAWDWSAHDVVINAAAYTSVDTAETPQGRRQAWAVNAHAPGRLAHLAVRHGFTLVHYSTDYVFDGTQEEYDERDRFAPLGVYGQSKAAGDLAVATAGRYYLIRTSWVIGDGSNFVATMRRLARSGTSPEVVDDQVGRLTSTADLAHATRHLLDSAAAYGTYNVTSGGRPRSWAEVARAVFAAEGRDPEDVVSVPTLTYEAGRNLAPRPRRSVLSLAKIRATGFEPGPSPVP